MVDILSMITLHSNRLLNTALIVIMESMLLLTWWHVDHTEWSLKGMSASAFHVVICLYLYNANKKA